MCQELSLCWRQSCEPDRQDFYSERNNHNKKQTNNSRTDTCRGRQGDITVEGDMGEKCATVVRVTGQGLAKGGSVGETRMVQERERVAFWGKNM